MTFKQDTHDLPSCKIRSILKEIDTHFESPKKVVDVKILNHFNAMRLRIVLRMVEGDRASLITYMKGIQEALKEGSKIYKSCLLLSKFTIEIFKKIKECEGQLASISQSYSPHVIFASNYEAQVMYLLDKIKSLNQEKDRVIGRVGEMRNMFTPQLDTLLTSQ